MHFNILISLSIYANVFLNDLVDFLSKKLLLKSGNLTVTKGKLIGENVFWCYDDPNIISPFLCTVE
jgi:hypothetical protein